MVVVAVTTLVLCLAGFTVAYGRMLPPGRGARSLAASVGCALAGALPWLATAPMLLADLPPALHWPVAALGGIAGLLASVAVRAVGARPAAALGFTLGWSLLVFVPAAAIAFATGLGGYAPVDHGGALAVHVAAGAGAAGVLLAVRGDGPGTRVATPLAATAIAVLVVGWLGWLAAAEFDVDEVTGVIVVNGLIAAAGGAAGWLGVQRIRHGTTTIGAVTAGVLSGLVAVSAGAPMFTPVSAAAAGVMAGALACWVTLARVSATRRITWFLPGTHLVAGLVGMFALGLLGTDVGFIFTGQVDFILGQLGSSALVAAWAGAAGFGMAWLLARVGRRAQVPSVEGLARLED